MNDGKKNIIGNLIMDSVIGCSMILGVLCILGVIGISLIFIVSLIKL